MIHFIPPAAISVCCLVTRAHCQTQISSLTFDLLATERLAEGSSPHIYKSIYYTIQMECNSRGRNNYQQGVGQ